MGHDIRSAEETDRLINQGKQPADVSVSVNLYEDASKAGQVQQTGDVISIFVSNIRRGGDAAQVLQSSYGLKRVGV